MAKKKPPPPPPEKRAEAHHCEICGDAFDRWQGTLVQKCPGCRMPEPMENRLAAADPPPNEDEAETAAALVQHGVETRRVVYGGELPDRDRK